MKGNQDLNNTEYIWGHLCILGKHKREQMKTNFFLFHYLKGLWDLKEIIIMEWKHANNKLKNNQSK